MYCMEYGSLILSYTSYIVHIQFKHQGRIQDLSEWVPRFISEQNNPDLGTKRRAGLSCSVLGFLSLKCY